MTACPDENALLDLVEGRLDDEAKRAVAEHLTGCAACQDVAAELARSASPAREITSAAGDSVPPSGHDGKPLSRGAAVGRYLVIDRVGAGAMGVVYAAYDPELGRKIALKLLHAEHGAESASAAALRARLLREAKALARLSHPNVVAVHDLGTFGDQVFVAMELVEGGTLGAWLHEAERFPHEIVRVLRDAGLGLAAAHAAGFLHRDFKPDNVLVGRDGRVKVSDFGLARALTASATEPEPSSEHRENEANASAEGPSLAAALTRTGGLVGTPAYMAPEQLEGRAVDARTDVFGFCVTAYEALYGERPFAARDVGDLVRAQLRGSVREPPKGSRVPSRLRKVLLRGLSPAPEARYQSMSELLRALDTGEGSRARRAIVAGAAAIVVIAAVLGFARRGEPPCSGAAHAWGAVWDEAQAARAREAFAKSGRAGADGTFAVVDRAFVAYRAAWEAMHTDACEATRVRGEQSEALLDRRMECLEERREEAEALGRVLAEADGPVVDRALSAIGSLRDVSVCARVKAGSEIAPVPENPEERAKTERVKRAIAEANALHAAGKYERAVAVAEGAEEEAKTLGDTSLRAKLLLATGVNEEALRRFGEAEAALHTAARTAEEAHDDATVADAWTTLVVLVGFDEARADEAHGWARYADAAIHRLGGDPERELNLLDRETLVTWYIDSKLPEALAGCERARELAIRAGTDLPHVARIDAGLGGVLFDMGKPEEALPIHRRGLAQMEALLGHAHPDTDMMALNVAEDLAYTGQPAEAIRIDREVLARGTYRDLGYVRHRLADALRRAGDAAAALAEDRAAAEMLVKQRGSTSTAVSPALLGIGLDLLLLGRAAEAIEPLERALTLRSTVKLAPLVADVKLALARALWDGGGDRARAVLLASEARDAYASAAEQWGSALYHRSASEASAWLAAHPLR